MKLTQEDKELLLKDLCGRLPYNVKVDITYSNEHCSSDRLMICSEGCLILNTDILGLCIEEEIYIKPYLRPMSSMTEKEEFELNETRCYTQLTLESYDWFLKNHFDYRDLIPMGLAIEVTEENNPYKN